MHKYFGISLFVWKLSSMGQMAFLCILAVLPTIWGNGQKLNSFSQLLTVYFNDVRLLKIISNQMEQGWSEFSEETKSIFMKRRKVHDTQTVHHLSLFLVHFQKENWKWDYFCIKIFKPASCVSLQARSSQKILELSSVINALNQHKNIWKIFSFLKL